VCVCVCVCVWGGVFHLCDYFYCFPGPHNPFVLYVSICANARTVVFNYGFVATVPSWLNEKGPDVSPSATLWTAVTGSTILFVLLGVFGALAVDFRCAMFGALMPVHS
jgi:hypothetical protein